MAENNQAQNPQESSEENKSELAQKLERQEKLVSEIEKSNEENPSADTDLKLLRERDTLRHLRLMQKGNPQKRAEAKANYAAKSAMNRAVQPGGN